MTRKQIEAKPNWFATIRYRTGKEAGVIRTPAGIYLSRIDCARMITAGATSTASLKDLKRDLREGCITVVAGSLESRRKYKKGNVNEPKTHI